MEKWKRELIRYLFHYSARRQIIEAAMTVKHPHIPSALYKYRFFKDQHKDALSNGVLWGASPDRMNDPYDAAVYFDQNRMLVEDQTPEEFMDSMESMKRALAAGILWIPKPIRQPIQQRACREKLIAEALKDRPKDFQDAFSRATDNWFEMQNEKAVQATTKWFRAGYSVLSLCENATSVLMWSHYSANHKGFCIEYDLSALSGRDPLRRSCYPVFYRKKLTDATRYLARRDVADYNNLFGVYICLLKSDEWSYEKEWRIVLPLGPSNANAPMQMPKPTSVILGVLVEPADEAWMRAFCRTDGIRLKRVVQRHNEFRLEIRNADP